MESPDLSNKTKIILLRHGLSKANELHERSKDIVNLLVSEEDKENGELFRVDFSEEIRDTELSEVGVKQCVEVQEFANNMNIHTVFCSPLRRALETTYHVFKSHPNIENIKFIVLPDMRECINISSDMPVNIEYTEKRFKELIPQLDFSEFDKFPDKKLYFLYNFDENVKQKVLDNLKDSSTDCLGSNAFEIMMEYAKPFHRGYFETFWNIYDRTERVKSLIIQNKREITEGNIILVGHGIFFRIFTGKWNKKYTREENLPLPDEEVILNNVQFLEYQDLNEN